MISVRPGLHTPPFPGMKDANATDKPADAAPAEKVTGQTIDVEVKEKTKS